MCKGNYITIFNKGCFSKSMDYLRNIRTKQGNRFLTLKKETSIYLKFTYKKFDKKYLKYILFTNIHQSPINFHIVSKIKKKNS